MARKRGGLGKGVESIDLKEPHGLAPTVAPPPPPPPVSAAPRPPASPPAPASAAAGWTGTPQEEDLAVVDVTEPDRPEPPPAPAPPKPAAPRKLDVSLLPWVIKKQIAGETDREDLDFRVIFAVKGRNHCLVLEGHRNDFGRIFAVAPGDLARSYLRWGLSDFARLSSEDALVSLRNEIEGIRVESDGYSLELGSVDDLLDWCSY